MLCGVLRHDSVQKQSTAATAADARVYVYRCGYVSVRSPISLRALACCLPTCFRPSSQVHTHADTSMNGIQSLLKTEDCAVAHISAWDKIESWWDRAGALQVASVGVGEEDDAGCPSGWDRGGCMSQ